MVLIWLDHFVTLLGWSSIPWWPASGFLLGEGHATITKLLQLALLDEILQDLVCCLIPFGCLLIGISLRLELLELLQLSLDPFLFEEFFLFISFDLRLGPSPFRANLQEICANTFGDCEKK